MLDHKEVWRHMRAILLIVSLCVFPFIAPGQAKVLANDPLTGLPLMPPPESARNAGNEPTKMPDGAVCKSKMQGNFYSFYNYFSKDNINLTDAIGWYTSHLSSYKKIETSNHRQSIFYNSEGTVLVIVDSETSKAGDVVKLRSVAYEHYQPGISEVTIKGMTQKQIVCH